MDLCIVGFGIAILIRPPSVYVVGDTVYKLITVYIWGRVDSMLTF